MHKYPCGCYFYRCQNCEAAYKESIKLNFTTACIVYIKDFQEELESRKEEEEKEKGNTNYFKDSINDPIFKFFFPNPN